jgi:hypothetical protein
LYSCCGDDTTINAADVLANAQWVYHFTHRAISVVEFAEG